MMKKAFWAPSPHFDDRPDGGRIEHIVLHATEMVSFEASLERLTDPQSEVSSHYLIREDGELFQLVDESKRAWHAGHSAWRGDKHLNATSIGIEIQNAERGLFPFLDAQIHTVIMLCRHLKERYHISPQNVVGHADIAPLRKVDPGPLFPWTRLIKEGLTFQVSAQAIEASPQNYLKELGYVMETPEAFEVCRRLASLRILKEI